MWQSQLGLCAQLLLAACLGVHGATLRSGRRMELRAEALAEASMKNGPLFPVAVNFDWKHHDPALGVTIRMDRDTGTLKMLAGITTEKEDIAWGYMKDELSKNGWIKLFLQTSDSDSVSNDVRMYSAGFIEGMLTAVRISQFYSNFYQTIMKDETNAQALAGIRKVFEDELEYVKTNSNFHPGVISLEPMDPYWKHMRYQFVQLWAIKDGYNFVAMAKGVRMLDLIDFLVINNHAILPELMQAYAPEAVKKRRAFQRAPGSASKTGFLQTQAGNRTASSVAAKAANHTTAALPKRNLTEKELLEVDRDWEMRLIKRGRCSALVRIAPENKDLLVGHTTWGDYASMTRIFKYYHFKLPGSYAKSEVIGFSSYPGCISSTDDYYVLDSGLVVMDTSLEILNMDLYNRIAEFPVNAHVPDFMHIMVANRMASSAPHWASLYTERNSGTGNAQWMTIDYNRFVPGKPVLDNTLFVTEQVPGMSFKKDMTYVLRDQGYWASYNRPYFPKIRDMTGHTKAESMYGALYSWGGGPRASIFKSVAPLSEHLMDMRAIMNRNNFPNEGILPNSPGHSISARFDLNVPAIYPSRIPNGGIDAKVVSRCLMRSMQVQAISGPSHDTQPVFKWMDGAAEVLAGFPHLGLPDVFDFSWVQLSPTAQLPALVDVNQCA